jgi:integrase
MAPRKSGSLPVILDQDELERLLAAPSDSASFQGLFALMAFAGLTVCEAVKASWGDLRWEGGEPVKLFVCGKGGKEAWLPLNRTLRETCRRRAQMRPGADPGEPIFPGPWNRRYSVRSVQRAMVRYGLAAGIPREKLHTFHLRHTCAVRLLRAGAQVAAVRRFMRHASLASLGPYLLLVGDRA